MPANRVVVILHATIVVLTIIATFIVTITNSLPQSWQKTLALAGVVIAALITATTTAIKFIDGSQKSEALQSRERAAASINWTDPDNGGNARAETGFKTWVVPGTTETGFNPPHMLAPSDPSLDPK